MFWEGVAGQWGDWTEGKGLNGFGRSITANKFGAYFGLKNKKSMKYLLIMVLNQQTI